MLHNTDININNDDYYCRDAVRDSHGLTVLFMSRRSRVAMCMKRSVLQFNEDWIGPYTLLYKFNRERRITNCQRIKLA